MQIRAFRFESRNPLVIALVAAIALVLVGIVLSVGLALGVALATVGVLALVARRLLGPRLPPPRSEELDPSLEVFPRSSEDRARLPRGEDAKDKERLE